MSQNKSSADDIAGSTQPTAVLYLRVSTKDQASRGNDLEGFSIPAQRDAVTRKAQAIGAQVIAEFIDAGESARSADRPELQRMLEFLESTSVTFVIVHKIDRLARNRLDDVMINLALKKAGARLVSVSENVDETPSGILLHGIMASIAEWYSANLSQEVKTKTLEKAKNGGTPMRAPIGYLNVRKMENGQEIRTVEVDPIRGPLMAWAFDAYATGDWTIRSLQKELTERGLVSVPGPKTLSQPLNISHLHRLLRHPYYTGVVRYRDVIYPGRHEALVPIETWNHVQDVLVAKNLAGERQRTHPHYLRGSIFCGQCESRLIVNNARGRHGGIYPYFVCIGRQTKTTKCNLPALRINLVEDQVERYYRNVRLTKEELTDVREFILSDLVAARKNSDHERNVLTKRIQRLRTERRKLLEAHYADAIPLELMKSEQQRIQDDLETSDRRISLIGNNFDIVEAKLLKALVLAAQCENAYRESEPPIRRTFNQAFFTRIFIHDDYSVTAKLAEPFDQLLDKSLLKEAASRRVSKSDSTFDVEGNPEVIGGFSNQDLPSKRNDGVLVGSGVPRALADQSQFDRGWSSVLLVELRVFCSTT
jgi:site-specific DNA recombinase